MTDQRHDRPRGRTRAQDPDSGRGAEPGRRRAQAREPGRGQVPGRGRVTGAPPAHENRHRLDDHAAIERLADELLPSLIAKLGATGLGEIEVREGDWKVRLRRPADAASPLHGRRASDRPSRAQPGHEGHGHAPAAVEPHRGAPAGPGRGAPAAGRGLEPPGRGLVASSAAFDSGAAAQLLNVATSPAVGFFQPRPGMTAGTKVRAGDTIATIDVLGVPQEVVAPVDGLIGASFVEPGEAVEYGQALIRIELPAGPASLPASGGASVAGSASAPATEPVAVLSERA